jgi:hypothetical protein
MSGVTSQLYIGTWHHNDDLGLGVLISGLQNVDGMGSVKMLNVCVVKDLMTGYVGGASTLMVHLLCDNRCSDVSHTLVGSAIDPRKFRESHLVAML